MALEAGARKEMSEAIEWYIEHLIENPTAAAAARYAALVAYGYTEAQALELCKV